MTNFELRYISVRSFLVHELFYDEHTSMSQNGKPSHKIGKRKHQLFQYVCIHAPTDFNYIILDTIYYIVDQRSKRTSIEFAISECDVEKNP